MRESGRVRMRESGRVRMRESGRVRMKESGRVRMRESGRVRMRESGRVRMRESGRVRATLESVSPNSSSLSLSGVAACCVLATCSPMRPISVRAPVSTTTPTAAPSATRDSRDRRRASLGRQADRTVARLSNGRVPKLRGLVWPSMGDICGAHAMGGGRDAHEMVVPEKTMLPRAWISAGGSATSSGSLIDGSDSPVSIAWSARSVVELSSTSRTSAGARAPTLSRTMSPGTRSGARSVRNGAPSRRTSASFGSYAFSASMAFSALDSCHTPTIALSTRMSMITDGSTIACAMLPEPSARARINDTTAAASSIFTNRSSNCWRTSFHHGTGGDSGSSFEP